MKIKQMLVALTVALTTTSAMAKSLTVADNETVTLKQGTHTYERIELGRNAVVVLHGSTTISTEFLSSKDGASFSYEKGSDHNNNAKLLKLTALDASGIHGTLFIDGSGQDGRHGSNGAHGANGTDEHTKTDTCYKRKLGVKIPYPCIKHTEPTAGGNGGHGTNGQHGEEAMDLIVYLYNLSETGHVVLYANGGNGGHGGHGGDGGKGGSGKRLERGQPGGHGGNGGNGGHGGDAGNIDVYLVYKDGISDSTMALLQQQLDKNIHANKGKGGLKGYAGNGGTGGDGGKGGKLGGHDVGIKRGSGVGGNSGKHGMPGSNGDNTDPNKDLISTSVWSKQNRDIIDQLFK